MIGFIGIGNMGGAIARAVCKSVDPKSVYVSNHNREKAESFRSLGCCPCPNEQIAKNCKFIFLGVKPQAMEAAVREIAPALSARDDHFVLVTMAAAIECRKIQDWVGGAYPVIRIMPNMPVSVGKGVVQYCSLDTCDGDCEEFAALLAQAGIVDAVPESMIDAACALSGSGPAFCFMFIEALADGAVSCGLPREKALRYAAQMVEGSARLVLESGAHPGVLKDQICSPAGTTIEGVRALEGSGFRSAAIEAVKAAYEKSRRMKRGETRKSKGDCDENCD